MAEPKKLKRKPTRADRNSPEASVEENAELYDELGKTEVEIREEDGLAQQESEPSSESKTTDGL